MKRRNDELDSFQYDNKRFLNRRVCDPLRPPNDSDPHFLQVPQSTTGLEDNSWNLNEDNLESDHNDQPKDGTSKINNVERISSIAADGSMKITISASGCKNSQALETVPEIPVQEPCTNCLDHSYVICKGVPEDVVTSIQSNPPKLIRDLNDFMKANKVHGSIKIYCTNCSCGPMSDWKIFWEHLVGKTHKKKVKLDSCVLMKVLICTVCSKIKSYCVSEDNASHKELPDDVSNIIGDLFPKAVQKVNPVEKKLSDLPPDKEPVNIQKKLACSVDIVFDGIKRGYAFTCLFDDIAAYAKENELNMQSIFVAVHVSDQTAFCRFTRSNPNKEYLKYQSLAISGRRIKAEIISSFEGTVSRFRSMPDITYYEWSFGDLTPLCLRLIKWDVFFNYINSELNEMDFTSSKYDWLTRKISHDLYRTISGSYTVTSIDYFGSRVTGLAFSNSDFDLQISTNENCTVRALTNKCLRGSQLFTVKDVIPWAKVPIIKVQHDSTGLMCDISLNNMNGVTNSHLLNFYLQIDSRVKWLVVAVKVWAKMNFIVGPFLFSSYTLAWLVLFFLMQDEIRLVPTVDVLTKLPCRYGELLHSEETSMRFSLDVNELRKVHNPEIKCDLNEYQLFIEFLHFCIKIADQDRKVALDTFTGEVVSRKVLFQNINSVVSGNLNDARKIFSYSLILIDPIKHYVNISAGVNSKLLMVLTRLCQQTLQFV